MPYIYYLFWLYQNKIKTLLNNKNKINTINPNYIQKFGFKIRKISIGAQKIVGFTLKTFEIVIIDFLINDKVGKPKYFQKIFLIAYTKVKTFLKIMLFFKLSNTNKLFSDKILI